MKIKKTALFALLLLAVILPSKAERQGKTTGKKGTVHMVSNAHFDTQWLWDARKSIDVFLKNTLLQNFYLLDSYPDYIFNFEGGVKYAWMKEYYPLEYTKVKNYISQGRWHVSGASWDATDTNIPSPESFFRNILLGYDFYKREFGVQSTDIFLPDCFGFSYILPSVAAHSGLLGFSTQKLTWRQVPFYGDKDKVPFNFGIWEGVDGSRIMAELDARGYGKKYENGDVSSDQELIDIVRHSPGNLGYRYFGTGDQGGSPSIGTVESISQTVRDGKGPVNVKFAASDAIFKETRRSSLYDELSVFKGELLMDRHGTGCYTSQAAMKRYNRANERLADAAERAAIIAEWLGGSRYPAEKLNEAWKRFIWHQFHDDLTGTSIPAAYQISWNDELLSQLQFSDILETASREVASVLDTRASGTPVIVFNSLGFARKETVHAFIPMSSRPAALSVVTPDGGKSTAQLIDYKDGRAEIVFAAEVAPMSYSVYDVRTTSAPKNESLKWGNNWIENSIYRVTLDANGDIRSILDKRFGKELVENGKSMRLAVIHGNESSVWPAWEILKETVDSPSVAIGDDVRISVEEKGPVRVSLKVEKKHNESIFIQRILLVDGVADDRIDIDLDIEWRQPNSLLKAEFPLSVKNPEATYDLGLGTIRRGNNSEKAYEVPAYQYADITSESDNYGISIITDYKVGWDKPADNTLRLSLIHTPGTSSRHVHSRTQDFGSHHISYSIVGHSGDNVCGGISRKADAKNNRLYTFNTSEHKGVLGRSFSMLSVDDPNIDVKAFKKTSANDIYVLRLYETSGQGVEDAVVSFATEIADAYNANGVEEVIGDAKFNGNKLYVTTSAFRPKTYTIRLNANRTLIRPVQCRKIELPYNGQAYTNDAFRWMADVDGRGHSYSWDILPRELVTDGIPFSFGNLGVSNVVKCDGRKVKLDNDGTYQTLYLLVASMSGDKKVSIGFGDEILTYDVPYYSGYYGQWGWNTETGSGYLKCAKVAYVGTHMHDVHTGNKPYTYTYMYKIAIPLKPGVDEIVLPNEPDIAIFAVTMSDEKSDGFSTADEFKAIP